MTAAAPGGAAAGTAGDGDAGRLAALFHLALAELAAARGGERLVTALLGTEEEAQALERLVEQRAGRLIVGCYDGAACGLGYVRHGEGRGRLELLFVEQGFRGVGVGEAIVTAAWGWCGEQGLSGLEVAVPPGARAAKSLFEQLGFVTQLLVMERRDEAQRT